LNGFSLVLTSNTNLSQIQDNRNQQQVQTIHIIRVAALSSWVLFTTSYHRRRCWLLGL
jgi:hypothetical protein